MISKLEALAAFTSYLEELSGGSGLNLAVLEDATLERPFGWVFFYQSKEFLESENFSDRLVGNSPVIVDRRDGSLYETGTAAPLETYLEKYEKYGDPNYCDEPTTQ